MLMFLARALPKEWAKDFRAINDGLIQRKVNFQAVQRTWGLEWVIPAEELPKLQLDRRGKPILGTDENYGFHLTEIHETHLLYPSYQKLYSTV